MAYYNPYNWVSPIVKWSLSGTHLPQKLFFVHSARQRFEIRHEPASNQPSTPPFRSYRKGKPAAFNLGWMISSFTSLDLPMKVTKKIPGLFTASIWIGPSTMTLNQSRPATKPSLTSAAASSWLGCATLGQGRWDYTRLPRMVEITLMSHIYRKTFTVVKGNKSVGFHCQICCNGQIQKLSKSQKSLAQNYHDW